MSRAWDKGSTTRWRRLRAAILAENQRTNNGACTIAIPGVCTGQAQCAHHVLGRAITGDDPKHIVAACNACNLHIGKPNATSPRPRRVTKW